MRRPRSTRVLPRMRRRARRHHGPAGRQKYGQLFTSAGAAAALEQVTVLDTHFAVFMLPLLCPSLRIPFMYFEPRRGRREAIAGGLMYVQMFHNQTYIISPMNKCKKPRTVTISHYNMCMHRDFHHHFGVARPTTDSQHLQRIPA